MATFRQQTSCEIILNQKWSEFMRAAVLMCLLVVAFQSFAQNEVSGVHGLVLRPDGKPIEGAFVLIRDYQQLNQGFVSDRWESRTGADGSFSFAAPNGCYDIFVSGNAQFLPFTQRVCVKSENQVLKIKLKPDPHPMLLQD
ncbi:MAG TPA: carboxypeptidase-like regulatory domain-containing protein [Candidatus Sulfotelmatobacter sp.]|nr:carboxypeptidase-like regulatory domain-containing protein [Candidatus Sulfotelmatobacter sp.]